MAESGSLVQDFFKGKTILITGATGFLAKIFVEKILRIEPNIKKLYVVVRASNQNLATQRLHNEVFGKDLFRVVREEWGEEFDSFISEKVVAVAGDISKEGLGLEDQNLIQEINVIVHSAAATRLDDRYDIAMGTNTVGASNALNFAKKCRQIESFLHLSTAYVCGEAEGVVTEEPFQMGQTLKSGGSSVSLDINLEKKLIEDKLSELRAQNANEKTITTTMREFGMTRANMHGWPNTYVFTKAMGEMLIVANNDNIPLIIARPSCITSTLSQPFPGWIEGARTADFVMVEYFKGTVTSFIGSQNTILDAIPADMVINSMIIALLCHSKNPNSKNLIYHICTSSRNPFKVSSLQDLLNLYATNNLKRHGKPDESLQKITFEEELLQNKGSRMGRIMELYRPYGFFKGIFDDKNAEILQMEMKGFGITDESFNFDPKSIDWKDYMMNIHFPGLVKYNM